MDGKKLEKKLIGFMEGESDILVATTIIENGLDVPNANTIFINNANNFGLSDLHQMRGRVGRSNKKAFCYFITPPINHISSEAQKRINAIQNYSELGSGIQIAMKDLEIRGAGALLGESQSGEIQEIGFSLYNRILTKAISSLKSGEIPNFDMVINATSIGLEKNQKLNLDFSKIGSGKFFFDVIYNPKETNFLEIGKNLGNETENGKNMFIFQAAQSFKIWHGIQPEIDLEVNELLDK